MHDKSKFDELLISYLSKELNEEDEAFVMQWINYNEENRQYYEEFKRVWKLLDVKFNVENINVKDEWNHFQQEINKKHQKATPPKSETPTYKLIEDPKTAGKSILFKISVSTAVAASVIILIGILSGLIDDQKIIRQPLAAETSQKIEALPLLVRHEKNTSGKSKHILLYDGSEITLLENSELSYQEPFAANTRRVTLKGKAHFKIARDKSKPFTVFSGDLSTTVLGTRFTVTAYEHAKNITVTLYEGKVVVKSEIGFKKQGVNAFYLSPGQELVYNKISSTATLRNYFVKPGNIAGANKINSVTQQQDVPFIPLNQKGSWYMFNNQSLEHVFQQLEKMYDVKIQYSKKDIDKKYFIGKFEKSVSVENVLKQIALLNNLKLVKQDEHFIIRK